MADSTPSTASQPSVGPLEGRTTIDDKTTFEPERLSYAAAARVAAFIAGEVKRDVSCQTVVVASDTFLADLGNLATANLQLEMLTDDYRRVAASLAPPAASPSSSAKASVAAAPALAATAVTAGLQSALGLVSLFRQDAEIKGVATRIDPRAFEIALASALKHAGVCTVIVPDLMALRTPLDGPGTLRGRWRAMEDARQAAWEAVGPLLADLGTTDAALDAATRNDAKPEIETLSRAVFDLRRRVEPLTQTLGQADRRLNDLHAQWEKANETTGLTLLSRLLRAEAIDAQRPRYLHAAVVAAGGHHRITRNLFRMIFLGDGLSAMGGVVVRWALLEASGAFAKGGIRNGRSSAAFPHPFLDDGTD